MISIAVQGYGIVIWSRAGEWRTYTASDSISAVLATRVEMALEARALTGLSIGFTTRKARIDPDTGIRTLTEIDLW